MDMTLAHIVATGFVLLLAWVIAEIIIDWRSPL